MSILNSGGDNTKYSFPLRPFSRSKMTKTVNRDWFNPTGQNPPPHSEFTLPPRQPPSPHTILPPRPTILPSCQFAPNSSLDSAPRAGMSLCSAPPRAGMPLAYYMQPLPDSNEPITGQDVLQATPTLNSNQLQRPTHSAYMPFLDASRRDEFYKRYLQLSERVAHKYPNQGPPVERQGRAGASWRHIKEVQGHDNRVLYVDGTVRLYDRDYLPTISSRNQPLGLARQTPCGALRPLHRDPPKQEVNWKPTQSARPINATTSFLPGDPNKYKGFYNYN